MKVTKEMIAAATEALHLYAVLGEDLVEDWMPEVLQAAFDAAPAEWPVYPIAQQACASVFAEVNADFWIWQDHGWVKAPGA